MQCPELQPTGSMSPVPDAIAPRVAARRNLLVVRRSGRPVGAYRSSPRCRCGSLLIAVDQSGCHRVVHRPRSGGPAPRAATLLSVARPCPMLAGERSRPWPVALKERDRVCHVSICGVSTTYGCRFTLRSSDGVRFATLHTDDIGPLRLRGVLRPANAQRLLLPAIQPAIALPSAGGRSDRSITRVSAGRWRSIRSRARAAFFRDS